MIKLVCNTCHKPWYYVGSARKQPEECHVCSDIRDVRHLVFFPPPDQPGDDYEVSQAYEGLVDDFDLVRNGARLC